MSSVSPSLTAAQAHILGGWVRKLSFFVIALLLTLFQDLAICFTLFLQGVLCSQFARYKVSTRRDSLQIKLFVAGLALLTTLKTSECLRVPLRWNFVPLTFVIERSSWYSRITVVLKATVAFYVQMFFCYRLWASVFGYIALPALDSSAVKRPGLTLTSHWRWFQIHMGVVVFGDFVLTGSIIFWLLSAAPITLCSLINFGVIILRASAPDNSVSLMVDFITNNILPQLYAWSAMWILNSRDEIVAAGNTSYTLDLVIASYASGVKTGQIPQASNGAVPSECAGTQ
ncbi:hypothetical protein C8R45DRAFT_1166761 [Mycena sanguinolenta]|nr:hypothetical protein C8R45DRAFT_1166761 [Mycena sanguinolenta]